MINPENLVCALYSADEMVVEAREAITAIPSYFAEKYGIVFHFSTAITAVDHPTVYSGDKMWQADEIYICSGADFETLYPEVFAANDFTQCKLQMMRLAALPAAQRIGPSLCGGLSLIHYKSFEVAPSLPALKRQYQQNLPAYLQWGHTCDGITKRHRRVDYW